jgi:fluoroquinolone resistance protein
MKQHIDRWNGGSGREFVHRLVASGRSGNGFSVSESPFGTSECGLLDLRGLRLPEKAELRRVSFAPANFCASSFKRVWFEGCDFRDSVLDSVSFQKVAEHGNSFTNCVLLKASFREAAIGYKGSRFQRCTFDRTDFSRAVFIRPEFDECAFYHCKLDEADLNGSSFNRCRFVGELRRVWFRGSFAHPNDVGRYGRPRHNNMVEVSFENASLRAVTFSNDCDLSSVFPPTDGRHALVDGWRGKLTDLELQCGSWPEHQRKAALAFASTNLVHAQTQNWSIINRDDLENEFGEETAGLIWRALAASPDSDRHSAVT